jgi:hypothetical protein
MKAALAACALALLAAPAPAQPPPVTAPLFRALEEALPVEAGNPIAAADMDGDGSLDLLCTNGIWLNDGGGRFSPLVGTPSLGSSSNQLVTGDFDGNGTTDIVMIDGYQQSHHLYLNPGDGQIRMTGFPSLFPPLPHIATSLAAGDVDGDGDIDLLVACGAPGWHRTNPAPPRLWLNDGRARFTDASATLPPGILCMGSPYFAIPLILDIDADGDEDLVILNGYTGPPPYPFGTFMNLVLINGGGTFTLAPGLPGSNPYSISAAIGDFDGDGYRDLAVCTDTWGTPAADVHLVRSGAPLAPTVNPLPEPCTLIPLDADGDGRSDLVAVGERSTTLRLVSPTGVLSAPVQSAPIGSWVGPSMVAFGDLDRDGDVDIAFTDRTTWRAALLLNTGRAAFLEVTAAVPGRFRLCRAADLDGDGNVDLTGMTFDGTTPAIRTAFNDGSGTFLEGPPSSALTLPFNDHWERLLFDGDGDGDPDLLAVPTLDYYTNDRTGRWTLAANLWHPGIVSYPVVRAGDLDGDGFLDVVLAQNGSSQLPLPTAILMNRGGGAFSAPLFLPGMDQNSEDVALADADGDGDLDIFQANVQGYNGPSGPGRLYLNLGGGTWVRSAAFAAPSSSGVAAGDLDGDGDVDAIFGNNVYGNDGTGTLTLTGTLPSGDPGRFTLADVDGDGDLDVVSTGMWFANLGALAFAPPEAFGYGIGSNSVLPPLGAASGYWPPAPDVVDVDGDGDLDVVSSLGRVYSNTLRNLARASLARPGRLASLEIHGPPGSPWLLAAASSPARIPLGAPGTLFLDPGSLTFVTIGTLDPSGTAVFTASVPRSPVFAGTTTWWQAWIHGAGRLTNLQPMTIVDP